jgi:long-subunit acyl-CoA synthetase (AMP-forming)
MDEFSSYLKKSFDFKQKREERQKELSKEKLLAAAKKKIQTTMIGSLSSMEKYFGFLWDIDNPTEEQDKLKEFFEEMRSEILDRGNTQIRNLENEFLNYEVVWKKYTINLPFIDRGDGNG